MRSLVAALALILATLALGAQAQADPSEYGIASVAAGASTAQAGDHPDFTVSLALKTESEGKLFSTTRDLFFDLPPGLLANPTAAHTCTAAQLTTTDVNDSSNESGCPQASQVGITEVVLSEDGHLLAPIFEPVFNLEPRFGEPARFGFIADAFPVFIDTKLNPDREYAATAMVEGASSFIPLLSATTTFWGTPAAEIHDSQRITAWEAVHHGGTPVEGKRPAGLVPVPYMMNPTRCGVAQGLAITAIPYALPGLEATAFAPLAPNIGCSLLDSAPDLSLAPTTNQAETGVGLNVRVTFPTDGFTNPNLRIEAAQKKAEVTLPVGVTVNPSQAEGLGVCSKEDLARETAFSGPNQGCPETSKIGTITATSPLLKEIAEGSLYIAKPRENPFGTLIALYLVLKIPERGIVVKLAAKVTPDRETGQLVTTIDDIPQLPVSSFELHFREGARSPLVTPPTCGTYESTARFTSWAAPEKPVVTHPTFEINRGVNGGPCPSGGVQPFHPGFTAGAINNNAGSFSPYYLRLTRGDGEQDLTKFSTTLPSGAVAKLAGVSQCSDVSIEAAKVRTGREEQANSSCPASSEIGHVLGGAGVGSVLTYAAGRLFLAGPYQGDPLSVVAIVPAVAGPFDVGTIVTRQALTLDPETGEAQVDGSHSDPIPHILAGIPLKVRDIRANVDRPEFTLNPTSCDREKFKAELWGGGLDVFSSADDSPVSLTSRFQAANCSLLGFKPRLSLKLSGGTRRGSFPALRAVLRPRPGDANLASAQVTLPRSAFIEQAHFRTVCTRVQFGAHQCPAGAVYGHIRAFSPLLDNPLEGPVYLRSSSHQLPDLVFALHGIVDVNVVGRVDSVHGRLRSSFESTPDVPVSKVVLQMQGGKKSLIVNSTNLCAADNRAAVNFTGQNGKTYDFNPVVGNSCGGKAKKHGKRGRGQRIHHS
jgi:hypothetical protein